MPMLPKSHDMPPHTIYVRLNRRDREAGGLVPRMQAIFDRFPPGVEGFIRAVLIKGVEAMEREAAAAPPPQQE